LKAIKHPFDEAVIAQTHPARYMMHKYWARKPSNVVARYIEYYTNPGDTVLDPFMGSGVTVVEAARLKRIGIGVDLNPVACLIARMTLTPVDTFPSFRRRSSAFKKQSKKKFTQAISSNAQMKNALNTRLQPT
jgi:DNA modification methylase